MKGECCSPLNSNSAQVHILTETILNFRFWIRYLWFQALSFKTEEIVNLTSSHFPALHFRVELIQNLKSSLRCVRYAASAPCYTNAIAYPKSIDLYLLGY